MAKSVFMFHAIGSVSESDWADPHYSCSEEVFHAFLKGAGKVSSLKESIAGKSDSKTIVTFDDGHISNYDAAKYMWENDLGTADFFINPERVGQSFYMNWDQIRELKEQGMSIQSHGLDHQYLSDCSDEELHRQLLESKRIIEKHIGTEVTILAPPGGRFDARTETLCHRIGYKHIAHSIPGHVSNSNRFLVPRISVLHHHTAEILMNAQSPLSLLILKQKIKYKVLAVAKFLLGNERYDKLRWQVLGDN